MSTYDARSSASRFRSAKTAASLIASWKHQPLEDMTQSPPAVLTQIQPTDGSPLISFSHQVHSSESPSCTTPIPATQTTRRSTTPSTSTNLKQTSYRRPLSDNTPAILPPSPKRLKFIEEDIDGRIEKSKKG